MRTFDRLLGLAIVTALVIFSISLGGSLETFIDIPSLILLAGATLGGLMIAVGSGPAAGAFVAALAGDEHDPQRLARHIHTLTTAHHLAWGVAMVGLFIGLMSMLTNMSDLSAIGGAVAVAMTPLFYAAVWAELIVTPLRGGLIRNLAEAEHDTEPTAAAPGPRPEPAALGHRPLIAFATVGWVLMWIFLMVAAFGPSNRDAEYPEVVESIREAFGYTTDDVQTAIVTPITDPPTPE